MKHIIDPIAALAAASGAATAADAIRLTEINRITKGAPIVLLADMQSGQILYSHNADHRFIPASITKVMSAYVAFNLIEAGEISLDQEFALSETAAVSWYRIGSTMFLETGEPVSVDTLLRGITSVSANDASIVLAEGVAGSVPNWTNQMNAAALKLGMANSHFATPNGWPDDGKTFTTAADLLILGRALITEHPKLYARYFGKEGMRYNGFSQANHDPISGTVEGADGIKTGFTNQAGHGFLGSAERAGTRLIMVVGAVDEEQTRADVSRDLINWGFQAFDRTIVFNRGELVASAKVQNGTDQSVSLIAADTIRIAVPKNAVGKPVFRITYQGPIEAPIKAGESVALLDVVIDRQRVARIPLAAGEDVAKAGFFGRLQNAFSGWFE